MSSFGALEFIWVPGKVEGRTGAAVAGTENCREIPLGHCQHFALHALLRNHKEYGLAAYKAKADERLKKGLKQKS